MISCGHERLDVYRSAIEYVATVGIDPDSDSDSDPETESSLATRWGAMNSNAVQAKSTVSMPCPCAPRMNWRAKPVSANGGGQEGAPNIESRVGDEQQRDPVASAGVDFTTPS